MILPLSAQCASLDLSKRLAALGMPQETYFAWRSRPYGTGPQLEIHERVTVPGEGAAGHYYEHDWKVEQICAAPTVAELGEMLPSHLQSDKYDNGKWGISWQKMTPPFDHAHYKGDTEADARASLLIALCERGVVKWG